MKLAYYLRPNVRRHHTREICSKAQIQFGKESINGQSINQINWPPQSSDLNPIENQQRSGTGTSCFSFMTNSFYKSCPNI